MAKYQREARPRLLDDPAELRLFLNVDGQGLGTHSLTWRVRQYFLQVAVAKRGACHLFRHTMATAMLDNGADIRHVQEILAMGRSPARSATPTYRSHARKRACSDHPAARFDRRHDLDAPHEEA